MVRLHHHGGPNCDCQSHEHRSGGDRAAGSPYTLTGAATTDFATYSTPITLATASATSEGTWTQAGNQIVIAVPANTTPGTTFAATIQYTVTGS
jgi:hypothetical protein